MVSGLVDRIKNAVRSLSLVSVPDHPATGGNTGDAEWPREEDATADDESVASDDGDADELE